MWEKEETKYSNSEDITIKPKRKRKKNKNGKKQKKTVKNKSYESSTLLLASPVKQF